MVRVSAVYPGANAQVVADTVAAVGAEGAIVSGQALVDAEAVEVVDVFPAESYASTLRV